MGYRESGIPFFITTNMLSTKHIISSVIDIPSVWMFEYYCKLEEKLTGQDIKILSLFNHKDKIPSLSIYPKNGKYRFKDFSNGNGGSGIDLVMDLFNLTYPQACNKIMEDYNEFILTKGDYTLGEFKVHSRYKITEFCKRMWNTQDRDYWLSYGIGSPALESYWVYPLSFYKMERPATETEEKKELNISGPFIYGYFRSNGELYKVYQPKIREKKFLNVKDYIQGTDQLKYACPNLMIGSSMKDILAFNEFKWPFEVVAPGSENTMIKKEVIDTWRHKYNLIITFFDTDTAGINAAKKYENLYGIKGILVPEEYQCKDLSDFVQKYGAEATMKELYPQLKELIKCKK